MLNEFFADENSKPKSTFTTICNIPNLDANGLSIDTESNSLFYVPRYFGLDSDNLENESDLSYFGINGNLHNEDNCLPIANDSSNNSLFPSLTLPSCSIFGYSHCYANDYYEVALASNLHHELTEENLNNVFEDGKKLNDYKNFIESSFDFSASVSSSHIDNFDTQSTIDSPLSISSNIALKSYDFPSCEIYSKESNYESSLKIESPYSTRASTPRLYFNSDNLLGLGIEIPSIVSFSNSNNIQNYVCTLDNDNDEDREFNTGKFKTEKNIIEDSYYLNSEDSNSTLDFCSSSSSICSSVALPPSSKDSSMHMDSEFEDNFDKRNLVNKFDKNTSKKDIDKKNTSGKKLNSVKKKSEIKTTKELKNKKIAKRGRKRGKRLKKNDEDEEYVCKHCGKDFPRKSNHDSHIRMHSTIKPYVCQFCSKAFVRRSDMNRHERSLHLKTAYRCIGRCHGKKWGCGHLYSRRDGLRKHWKSLQGRECLRQFLKLDGILEKYDEIHDLEKIIELTRIF